MKYLFWFLLLIFCFNCNAQHGKKTEVASKFGVIIFPNFTKASAVSYVSSASAFNNYKRSYIGEGIGVKVFSLIAVNKKFSLQPEFGFTLYDQKQIYCDNAKLNALGSVSYTDKLSEGAISMSALLNYNFKLYSLCVGPQYDFISSAKINSVERLNGYGNINRINEETNFKKDRKAKSGVFLLKFGISRLYISKKFGIGIFYIQGLSDFTEYSNIRKIGKISGISLDFNFFF